MEKRAETEQLVLEKDNQMIEFYDMVSYSLRGPLVNISLLMKFIVETSNPAEQQLLISKLASVTENLDTVFNELTISIQAKRKLNLSRLKL